MRFARTELAFMATGAGLGAVVGLVARAGWIAQSGSFPPFVFLLLGLALIEIAAAVVTKRPPGTLVAMPARILAFALGVGVLMLIAGGLS